MENIQTIVAVAGESKKAEAIMAVLKNKRENVLTIGDKVEGEIINGKDE